MAAPFCIPTSNEWQCCSTYSPPLGVSVWDFSYSNRGVAVSYCCCKLHFPDEKWLGASFYMFICSLYIFFDEVSVQIFCPFLNWVVCSFSVEFQEFWIFGTLVFYQICVLRRFSSKSVSSLFLLLYHLITIFFFYKHFNFYLIKSSLELLNFVSSLGKSPSTESYILLYYFTFVAFFHIDIFNSSWIFFMLVYSLKTLISLFLGVEKTFLITLKSLFFPAISLKCYHHYILS